MALLGFLSGFLGDLDYSFKSFKHLISSSVFLINVHIYVCCLYSFGFNFSFIVNDSEFFFLSLSSLDWSPNRFVHILDIQLSMFYDYFLQFLLNYLYLCMVLVPNSLSYMVSTVKTGLTGCPNYMRIFFRVTIKNICICSNNILYLSFGSLILSISLKPFFFFFLLHRPTILNDIMVLLTLSSHNNLCPWLHWQLPRVITWIFVYYCWPKTVCFH